MSRFFSLFKKACAALAGISLILAAPPSALHAASTVSVWSPFNLAGVRTYSWSTTANSGTIRIGGSTQKIAYKIWPNSTSAITHVSMRVNVNGTTTNMNWKMGVFADSSDAPGSQVGGYTATFTQTADGFTGLKALTSNTGTLTLGEPYWIVLEYDSGSATPDGTNNISSIANNNSIDNSRPMKQRHYNGTDWTTTTANVENHCYGIQYDGGAIEGLPITNSSGLANSGLTDIFSTNRQGLKFKVGNSVQVEGIAFQTSVAGTPGNVTVKLYNGSTEIASTPATPNEEMSGNSNITLLMFSTPVTLSSGNTYYATIEQDGVSDSNDHDIDGHPVSAELINAMLPPDTRFIAGSGSDPTAYTVDNDFVPFIWVLCSDPAEDYTSSGSGGASAYTYVGS